MWGRLKSGLLSLYQQFEEKVTESTKPTKNISSDKTILGFINEVQKQKSNLALYRETLQPLSKNLSKLEEEFGFFKEEKSETNEIPYVESIEVQQLYKTTGSFYELPAIHLQSAIALFESQLNDKRKNLKDLIKQNNSNEIASNAIYLIKLLKSFIDFTQAALNTWTNISKDRGYDKQIYSDELYNMISAELSQIYAIACKTKNTLEAAHEHLEKIIFSLPVNYEKFEMTLPAVNQNNEVGHVIRPGKG